MWQISTLGGVTTRAIAAATLVLGSVFILAGATSVASAENEKIAAEINGEPITETDIERRRKFDQLSTHREWSREEVIEQLITEKFKLGAARGSGIDVTDSDVDAAYASMAKRMKLTPDQLTGALAHAGVEADTLKQRIRADIAWQRYARRSGGPVLMAPSLYTPRSGVPDLVEPAPRKKRDLGPSWRE